MKRCSWCNLNNPKYVEYHDNEWGEFKTDDKYLLEMLILESFQAGLSWECVLNKRDDFRKCYDDFDLDKICNYDDNKINELLQNKNIIRNKLKIKASINNAKIFRSIKNEYGTFYNYLKREHFIYPLGNFLSGDLSFCLDDITNFYYKNLDINYESQAVKVKDIFLNL